MNKKMINGGAVASKILGGLLFFTVLTAETCNSPGNSGLTTTLTPAGIPVEVRNAQEQAELELGGWGPCEGDCLLYEAAGKSRAAKDTNKKTEAMGVKRGQKYYKLVEEINSKPFLEILTKEPVLEETKKGQKKGTKPSSKNLVIKEGITGTYKTFVEAILKDQADKKETRHAKLMLLVEGLRFVKNISKNNLDNEDGSKQQKEVFEKAIDKAKKGIYALVLQNETINPPIDFVDISEVAGEKDKDKQPYQISEASVKAAEQLIKDVESIVNKYRVVAAKHSK